MLNNDEIARKFALESHKREDIYNEVNRLLEEYRLILIVIEDAILVKDETNANIALLDNTLSLYYFLRGYDEAMKRAVEILQGTDNVN